MKTTLATSTTPTKPTENTPGFMEQARETIASVAGTVQHAVGIDRAKPGKPKEEDVTRLRARRYSLPSQEPEGALPGERSGGVGALPGPLNESGVALLPDERNAQAKEPVRAFAHAITHPINLIKAAKQARRGSASSSSSSSSELPEESKEEGIARLRGRRYSLPSQEPEGAYPGERSGGVGALPGPLNESGVAILPDERNAQAEEPVGAFTHPIETAKQARRGSASSSSSSSSELTEEFKKEGIARLRGRRYSLPSQEPEGAYPGERCDGVGALPGPLNESGVVLLPDERNAQAEEPDGTSTHAADQVPLKDKVAGGVKTAMGKVWRDEELVAEGKAQRGH